MKTEPLPLEWYMKRFGLTRQEAIDWLIVSRSTEVGRSYNPTHPLIRIEQYKNLYCTTFKPPVDLDFEKTCSNYKDDWEKHKLNIIHTSKTCTIKPK